MSTRRSGSGLIWCPLLLFCSVTLISLLVVLGCWLIQLGLMGNSERPGFPIFVALGKGKPALRNSMWRLKVGYRFCLRFPCLSQLTSQILADVVRRKGATAGSLDGWDWRELKVLLAAWFDGLASILCKVEEIAVWPDGLLDAIFAMIPKTDGDATPLGQRASQCSPSCVPCLGFCPMVQLEDWFRSWVPASVLSAGGGRESVEAWYTAALDIEEVLSGAADSDVHLFVVDVIKSLDTVDRGILDRVLSSLGLPGWFRHAYFEYHAHVRLRFKLAAGLGEPWTRDESIPQGCPLSTMFIVALYLPWCRYLAAHEGVQPQLYADNLNASLGSS